MPYRQTALSGRSQNAGLSPPTPGQERRSPEQNTEAHFFPPRRDDANARAARKPGKPLVGIAWDAAFSFCYADLPALLYEYGADVVLFSPLEDAAPPPGCAGLYFPGGYPELHAARLASNTAMHEALRRAADHGVSIYGECGGYMYLMRTLQTDGRTYAMSGLLPRTCLRGAHKAALGYRAAQAHEDWPGKGFAPLWVRGHEFHYAQETAAPLPTACRPLWKLYDSRGGFLRDEGCRLGSVAGSWLHCYPEGARRFWRLWVAQLNV